MTDRTMADYTPDAQGSKPSAPLSRNSIVKNWLRKIYLERDYHGISVSLNMEDFLNIIVTASMDAERSWLTEDQLTLPLILLAFIQKRSAHVLIVPTLAGLDLCAIGVGTRTRDIFTTQYPELYATMKDENGPRWIVVPCSDGMLTACTPYTKEPRQEAHATSTKAKGAQSKGKRGNYTPQTKSTGVGSHWGLMIIDRKRQDARWLDGHVELKRKPSGKMYIKHMFNAGKAAGKVLRGYDQVMENAAGYFQTGTLKYVPHDTKNNRCQSDKGSACGPYAFAMLQYLFQNHSYLDDLAAAFPKSASQSHIKQLNFNSKQTRAFMQDITRDEAEKTKTTDELPYKLSAQILDTLARPRAEDLRSWLDDFLNAPDSNPFGKGGSYAKAPGGNDDSSDDNDGGDGGTKDQHGNEKIDGSNLEKLLQIIHQQPETFANMTKEQQMTEASMILQTQNAILEGVSQPAVGNEGSGEEPRLQKTTQFFNIAAALQSHEVNFVALPADQLRDFVAMNLMGNGLTHNMHEWEQRAILTKVFGNFDKMSKDDSARWKAMDPRFKNRQDASHQDVITLLKDSVQTVPNVTLRGLLQNYPRSYLSSLFAHQAGSRRGDAGTGSPSEKAKLGEGEHLSARTSQKRSNDGSLDEESVAKRIKN